MAETIIIVAEATAKAGQADAVRDALRTCAAASRAEPGNVVYQPLEGEVEGAFIVYEIWRDRDAVKAHEQAPHFKTLVETIGPLCGSISIRVMDQL